MAQSRREFLVSSAAFDEGTLGRVGLALEHALGVADERPPGFS